MNDIPASLRSLARQEQFLDVVDRDEAERRFRKHLELRPLGCETVPLAQALGRVVARRVVAEVDVPGFDRASVDGFAVHADGTLGASERTPRRLTLLPEILTPGKEPRLAVEPGTATLIATGGMVPRGADAVVMVEHTETAEAANGATVLEIRRAAAAGQFVAFAGSDMARGETVLRAGQVLTSREIGMLAAVGCATVEVWRRPRVAIISTGDEIIAPGAPMRPGAVFDSNAAILAAAVEEAGGVPCPLGIGADDDAVLTRLVEEGLAACDMVILSGGTSKGAGDLCYRAVARFRDPGIVVHGVALKPGKPLCLAVTGGKPVVVLAGVSDLSDLHLSRIRGAGHPRLCRASPRTRREAAGDPAAARRLGTRPDRISDGFADPRRPGRRPFRLSECQGLGGGHRLQPGGRVHRHRCASRKLGGRHAGRSAADRRCPSRRSRDHRQPLRRARHLDRPPARRGDRGQGAEYRQHGRARRRQARRMRHRRDPSDGPRDRRIQSSVLDPGARTGARLSSLAGHRLPQRRPALRPAARSTARSRRCWRHPIV